jgi:hypothetical protein
MSLTKATFSMIQGAVINVLDFMTEAQKADVLALTAITNFGAALDVTTAVQTAIDKAGSNVGGAAYGGTVVYFPAGAYKCGALEVKKQFVSLQGDGMTATTIVSNGAVNPLLFYGDTSTPSAAVNFNSFIKDIKFISGGAANVLLFVSNIAWFRVENCWFEGSSSHVNTTVVVASALLGKFEQCIIRGATQNTVDIYKAPGYSTEPNCLTFSDCTITSGNVWGLRFIGGSLLRLLNMDFESNGNVKDVDHGGVYIDDGSPNGEGIDAVLDNCWFEANKGVNVKIGQHGFAPGGTLMNSCLGVSGDVLYGVYGPAPTGGNKANATLRNCTFQSATDRDFYFETGFNAALYDCLSNTALLSASSSAFPNPSSSVQSTSMANYQSFGFNTFTDGDTSPLVTKAGLYVAANTSATSITTFDGGADGQILMINADNGNTTLVNGSTLRLAGGVNKTMATRDVIQLVYRSTVWYQMSYSTN